MIRRLRLGLSLLRERPLFDGLRAVADRGLPYVVDAHRTLLLLEVDLRDPRANARPKDGEKLHLELFSDAILDRLLAMLRAHAPHRVDGVYHRAIQGIDGYVLCRGDELLGHVYFTAGCAEPARPVHPDLEWLGVPVGLGDVYVTDYYVREDARGAGMPFVRLVQSAHLAAGFTRAVGYVDAKNTAALFTYRATGWRELGRRTEHRLLRRLAVVDDTLYRIHPYWRERLGPVPRALARTLELARPG